MHTTCPFCNAEVQPGRPACLRCGESLPASHPVVGDHVSDSHGTLAQPRSTVKRANRRLGLLVFLGMILLFVGALVAVVNSRSKRGLETLSELDVLGYLPDDTNVIAAINVPNADASLEGREILDRLGVDPGGTIDLQKYSGISREQIDTALLGLKVDSNLFPRVRLVVRTRDRYNAAKLRERLGSTRSRVEGKKTIDLVKLPDIPFELALWCATPRTFILCYPVEDLAKVPDEPTKDIDRLAAPLAELLRTRSDRETFFWLVAHSDNWEKSTVGLLLAKISAEDRSKIFGVRTVGLGLRLDRGAVTTRSRPARITEVVTPDQRGVAADLVLLARGEIAAVDARNALEDRLEKLNLEIKDSSLKETRYSATISGKPSEWERAFQSFRNQTAK